MTLNVAIYIYPEVEILDVTGPYETFFTAERIFKRQFPACHPTFRVFLVAEKQAPLFGRGDFQLTPHYDFDTHPGIDILIIPGGLHMPELDREKSIQWIQKTAKTCLITASVCTGAFLLAKAGLLHQRQVTTHWEDLEDLQAMFPDIHTVADVRWVDEGEIVTSAGISAGVDMSLHLIRRLVNQELAEKTAKQMEFDWKDNGLNRSAGQKNKGTDYPC